MANEILSTGVGDLIASEAITGDFLLLNASRDTLDNHPALFYAGDTFGSGTKTLKLRELGLLGYDIPSAGSEGTPVANTALTDGSVSLTPGWYPKSYEASDWARFVQKNNLLDSMLFAQDAIVSAAVLLMSLCANVVDDFTATVGSTGVDLTVANWMDACATLQIANVPEPYMALLHPRQLWDLKTALNSAGGALQWMQATADQLRVRGGSYQGNFIGVDIWKSTLVPTKNAGADRGGGMWGRGGVVWADMSVVAEDPNSQMAIGETAVTLPNGQVVRAGKVLFEKERTAKAAQWSYVSHMYRAASKGIDNNGVSIITDA